MQKAPWYLPLRQRQRYEYQGRSLAFQSSVRRQVLRERPRTPCHRGRGPKVWRGWTLRNLCYLQCLRVRPHPHERKKDR